LIGSSSSVIISRQFMPGSRRQPSTSFPGIPLREAVETIREVAKYGSEQPRNAFAQYLGHSTAYSGPFKSKLAAFRDWNFVTTGPDVVSLTPLAERLAFPPDPDRVRDDLTEAFRSCAPFLELYESCAKGQPLERSTIANNAVHRLRVSPSAKDRFADSFIESVVFAGLGEQAGDGRIRLLVEPRADVQPAVTISDAPSQSVSQPAASSPPGATSTRIELPWPVQGGRVVVSVELDRPLPASAFRQLTEISSAVELLVHALDESHAPRQSFGERVDEPDEK
jgi:hypothetical protein